MPSAAKRRKSMVWPPYAPEIEGFTRVVRCSGVMSKQAHRAEPPRQIVSAITARHAGVLADREKDAAAGAMQLFGDLRARCAGADHQHRARRQLFGIDVAARVNLKDAGFIAQQVRHHRPLIGAGGDDDIFRVDLAVGRLRDETGRTVARQPRHRDAAADRRRDEIGVGVDEGDDIA